MTAITSKNASSSLLSFLYSSQLMLILFLIVIDTGCSKWKVNACLQGRGRAQCTIVLTEMGFLL